MEEVLIALFLVVPLVILVFVLPIVAIVKASRLKRRVANLENEVESLYAQLSTPARQTERVEVSAPVSVEQVSSAAVPPRVGDPIYASVVAPEKSTIFPEEPPVGSTEETSISQGETESGTIEIPKERAAAHAVQGAPCSEESEDAEPQELKEEPRPAGPSIEERIGVVWFTRIGAVVGMAVAAWFFKYMVDNDWIGPWGRVAAGAVVGLLFLGLGEFLYRRKRTHPVFNQGMLGLGLALLLITAYASFGFYHLVSVFTAFGVVAVLCLLGGALSHYHKSEIILVFSLLAAFLNPVMLSTGTDRPGALFSYLLLMTGAAYVPAVIHGFRTATFIAAGGAVLLFNGWYARFFDIHPAPLPGRYDAPEMNRSGAYFDMAARWIPLLFSVLFTGEWVAVALLHLRKARRITGLVLILIAAVWSHGIAAALLYDHPLLLGVGLLGIGLLFAVLFVRNKLTQWLFLTMTSSFVILAYLKDRMDAGDLLPMMIVSGLLSALYFGVFLRAEVQKERPSAITRLLIGGAGLGFFLLGILFLAPAHPLSLAGFSTVLAGVFLLAAAVIVSPVTALVASAVGFVGLLISNTGRAAETDLQFIAVAGGWFVLHTALIAYDALKRKRAWTLTHLLILSFAGIGFTGLFISAAPPDADILRALLSIAEGVVYLLIGMLSLRQRTAAMKRVSLLPLGTAAAAFTLAAGFLLSGASLTAAWAAEAVVFVYLAARVRPRGKCAYLSLLIASIALFFMAVIHLFISDVPWIGRQQSLYLQTAGASGVLLPSAFAHPAAWALGTISAAFLLSVAFLKKSKRTFGKGTGIGFLIAGHSALLWLLVHEFCLMFTAKPNIPPGIPKDELLVLWNRYQEVVLAQAMRLETVTTVVMGTFALFLIVLGFIIRDAWHRRMGMVLFAGTLIKLSLFDIWNFETLFRIIVGGTVALLLLIGGFLYARFGHRLKAIVSDNGGKTLGGLILLAVTFSAADARAFEIEKCKKRAVLSGIEAPGDYVLEVSPALYQASDAFSPFADIRIVGPDGAETPFAVFSAARSPAPRLIDARVLDPQMLPDGAFRVVLDLGESPPVHARVRLRLSGTDYLRSVQVESGTDGVTFGVIKKDAWVYNIPSKSFRATQSILDYPESGARYLRITIQKGMDKGEVRIISAQCETAHKNPIRDARREIALPLETVFKDTDDTTVYPTAALPEKIPFDALRIETDEYEFARQIKVETSTHKNAWFPAGTWSVYRIRRGPEGTESIAERLLIPTGSLSRRPYVRLKVDNGDNPPLNISAVFAQYTADALVLRATTPGPHTLYVKHADVKPPQYDLAALIAKGSFLDFKPVFLGTVEDNPLFQKEAPVPKVVPWTETHSRLIQVVVLIVALLLLLWTVRLLRKSKKS